MFVVRWLEPVDLESDSRGSWIVGRAWILGDGDGRYRFRLRIGERSASRPADWSELVPGASSTAWLSLDRGRKRIEIDPFASIPEDE